MAMATLWFADNDFQGTHPGETRQFPSRQPPRFEQSTRQWLRSDYGHVGSAFGPGASFVLAEGDCHYVWTGDEPAVWDVAQRYDLRSYEDDLIAPQNTATRQIAMPTEERP